MKIMTIKIQILKNLEKILVLITMVVVTKRQNVRSFIEIIKSINIKIIVIMLLILV